MAVGIDIRNLRILLILIFLRKTDLTVPANPLFSG